MFFSSIVYMVCPALGSSAGEDKLIKDVHTMSDPDLLQCQYVKSIVFMPPSFLSQPSEQQQQ